MCKLALSGRGTRSHPKTQWQDTLQVRQDRNINHIKEGERGTMKDKVSSNREEGKEVSKLPQLEVKSLACKLHNIIDR